ncbi:hypothetical protein [Comamonas thiooxydans]|uniref:hypothetical protein n=1 Tax=Comamonas thiooxydans TaxID=363952 RepID=UPI001184D224|nr:hypothetical protein [Comamonas thiooxydans]
MTIDAVALEVQATPDPLDRSAHLRRGQEKLAQMRAEGWKPVHRTPVEQARDNPNSQKAAIKAFCWICVGADADPGAKFRVRDCDVGPKCPLHPHRPWQNVKGGVSLNADGEFESNAHTEDTSGE